MKHFPLLQIPLHGMNIIISHRNRNQKSDSNKMCGGGFAKEEEEEEEGRSRGRDLTAHNFKMYPSGRSPLTTNADADADAIAVSLFACCNLLNR